MKKIITTIIIITLIALSSVFFFSCALFNKGTLDETYGIYGITDAYYKLGEDVYRFGHKYEYFLIIVNENNKATIKYKTVENDEVSYEIEYNPTYRGEGDRVVNKLDFKQFKYIRYLPNSNKELVPTEVVIDSYSGNYGRFKQGLKFSVSEPKYNSSEGLKWHTNAIEFERLYDKRTEKNINKAIEKQKENINDRATAR